MSISYPLFTINSQTFCYIITKEFITTNFEGRMLCRINFTIVVQ